MVRYGTGCSKPTTPYFNTVSEKWHLRYGDDHFVPIEQPLGNFAPSGSVTAKWHVSFPFLRSGRK
jgi:hypothetical protein